MAAISSLTPNAWRGQIQGVRTSNQTFRRAGVSGTGMLVGGTHGAEYAVETDYFGTLAECDTWRNTALGLVGTKVSVTDAWGATWSDTLILDVRFRYIRAMCLPSTATHILRAEWDMLSEV